MEEKRFHFYRWFQRASVILALGNVIIPLLFWNRIPSQIPMHFNFYGIIDDWSDKASLFFLFLVLLILTGGMSIAAYSLRISAASPNSSEAEKKSAHDLYPMLTILHFVLQLMFSYIIFCSITCRNLGVWFLPVILFVSLFGPILYLILRSGIFSKKREDSSQNDRDSSQKYQEIEEEATGESYRSKIDWWLGLLLFFAFLMPLFLLIKELLKTGECSLSLLFTQILLTALFIPLFRTRYILYPEHMTIVCIGKVRIPYRNITGIKATHNPLSSAALSLDRLQIDYQNHRGSHEMLLISPVHKQEFLHIIREKIREKTDLNPPAGVRQ